MVLTVCNILLVSIGNLSEKDTGLLQWEKLLSINNENGSRNRKILVYWYQIEGTVIIHFLRRTTYVSALLNR